MRIAGRVIGSFEVGTPLMWAAPLGGSLQKRTWKKEASTFCLLVLTVAGKFICPVAQAFLHWYQNFLVQDSKADREPEALQEFPGTLALDRDC